MIFKVGDKVVLTNNKLLLTKKTRFLAGEIGTIVCKCANDEYEIEFNPDGGFRDIFLIPADLIIPASKEDQVKKPKWLSVAENWQRYLWNKNK
jgi:hypothetical protein